ncbi:PepSY domain-containing protein [Micromonospora sp. NPDC092111]|uniref:PepSY domain-containing protein n=1 Tax=Micromonospora sp. NPDC092111 TaxID=3364289 RepID=UPI00382D83F6
MRRTSLILASAGGVAVLALTGAALGATAADRRTDAVAVASTATDDAPTPEATSTTDDAPTSAGPTPTDAGRVDRARAGTIARAAVGGGRVVEVEAEQEHGRPVWSVEVLVGATGWDVHVDRLTGVVLRTERDRSGDDRSAGDDRSGTTTRAGHEPGDDHGGDREPGDDHGGTRESGDDHGGGRDDR